MNPFTVLGLPTDAGLTDEQVRAAWRAIAAATHPDRPDGGNVARYTAAATAYAQLRTAWGRRRHTPTWPPISRMSPPRPRCRSRRVAASSARPGWSRPGSGTGGPGICWPAPWPPPSCPCWWSHLLPGQPSGPAIVTGLVTWFVLHRARGPGPAPGTVRRCPGARRVIF